MKKLVLIVALVFMSAVSYLNAQVIENFESITMNIFSAGTNGAISVVANPDQVGNESLYVGKMVRGFDGDPWAGWYATLSTPIDVTANRYVHVKLWKPRISPVVFKYEGTVNSGDVYPINAQTLTSQWEELVFDMSVVSGDYVKIVLIPDFETPLTLTEDIVIYYDDLYANDDPTVGSAAVQVMENFETIPLNYMLNGVDDNSYMELVSNPDQSGVNLSSSVIHFFRDKDGYPWDGFWSSLPAPIDVTDNKYVHVKVWKPRITPIKFKIEKPGENHEIFSLNEQTLTDAWEDIVFDFSSWTGEWTIIAFLPDFEDPVTLTEDIDIYFDDFILNNDPNPIMPPSQTISVDMTESGMTAGEPVWIAGALGGIYGTWAEPGTNPNNQMLDPENDGIYSITLSLPEGIVAFKFFWANGWANGDPAPGGDRTLELTNSMDVLYKWGVDGIVVGPSVTFNVDMTNADPFDPATDDVYISGDFAGWAQPGTNTDYMMTPSENPMIYTITITLEEPGTIAYKYFRVIDDVASWDNGEWTGDPNRTLIVESTMTVDNIWATLGINEYAQVTFKFYPNPVNDQLTIDNLEGANKIEIFNITGEKLQSLDNISTNSVLVNTANLEKGMYMLVVYHNDEVQATKFIK